MPETPKSDPQMIVLASRGRGRPRVESPRSLPVSSWIEARHYDELVKLASTREKSMSALVRDLLLSQLK